MQKKPITCKTRGREGLNVRKSTKIRLPWLLNSIPEGQVLCIYIQWCCWQSVGNSDLKCCAPGYLICSAGSSMWIHFHLNMGKNLDLERFSASADVVDFCFYHSCVK